MRKRNRERVWMRFSLSQAHGVIFLFLSTPTTEILFRHHYNTIHLIVKGLFTAQMHFSIYISNVYYIGMYVSVLRSWKSLDTNCDFTETDQSRVRLFPSLWPSYRIRKATSYSMLHFIPCSNSISAILTQRILLPSHAFSRSFCLSLSV